MRDTAEIGAFFAGYFSGPEFAHDPRAILLRVGSRHQNLLKLSLILRGVFWTYLCTALADFMRKDVAFERIMMSKLDVIMTYLRKDLAFERIMMSKLDDGR